MKGHCKDCKQWKDSDGAFRRGIGAESICPINTLVVQEGDGYCYMFEPQESGEKEQEPCSDAISRQVVLDAISELNVISFYEAQEDSKECYYEIRNVIKQVPPVKQEPKWIPCSEMLPEKSGVYWCTFGGTNLTGSDYYTTESDAKEFFVDPEEYAGWRSQNVIAWMPLPLSYKPD